MKIYNVVTKQIPIFSIDTFNQNTVVGLASGEVELYTNDVKITSIKKHTGAVLCVRYNKDGTLIATSSDDGTIIIYNSNLYVHQIISNTHKQNCDITNVSWTNNYFISVGQDGQLIFYNDRFNIIKSIFPHRSKITGLSTYNSWICTQGEDGIVLYRDTLLVKKIPPTEGIILESFFSRMSFSPDGSLIACGLSFNQKCNSVEIYNLQGENVFSLLGHVAPIECVSFNPVLFLKSKEMFSNDKNILNNKEILIKDKNFLNVVDNVDGNISHQENNVIKNVCIDPNNEEKNISNEINDVENNKNILSNKINSEHESKNSSYDISYYILAVASQDLSLSFWTTFSPHPFLLIKNFSTLPCLDMKWNEQGNILYVVSYDGTCKKLHFDINELGQISKNRMTTETNDLFLTLKNAELYDKKFKEILQNTKNNKKDKYLVATPIKENVPLVNKDRNNKDALFINTPVSNINNSNVFTNNNFIHNKKINFNSDISKDNSFLRDNVKNINTEDFNDKIRNTYNNISNKGLNNFNNLIPMKECTNNTFQKNFSMNGVYNKSMYELKNIANEEIVKNTYNKDIFIGKETMTNNVMYNRSNMTNLSHLYTNNNTLTFKPSTSAPSKNEHFFDKNNFKKQELDYKSNFAQNNIPININNKNNNFEINKPLLENMDKPTINKKESLLKNPEEVSHKKIKNEEINQEKLKNDQIQKNTNIKEVLQSNLNTDETQKKISKTNENVQKNTKTKEITEKNSYLSENKNDKIKNVKRRITPTLINDNSSSSFLQDYSFNYNQSVKIIDNQVQEYFKTFGDYTVELHKDKSEVLVKRNNNEYYSIQGDIKYICGSKKYLVLYTGYLEIYNIKTGTLIHPLMGCDVTYMDLYKDNILYINNNILTVFNINKNIINNINLPLSQNIKNNSKEENVNNHNHVNFKNRNSNCIKSIRFSKTYFIILEYTNELYVLDKQKFIWYLLRKDWNDIYTNDTNYNFNIDFTLKKLENKFIINYNMKRIDKLKKICRKMVNILLNIKLNDHLENIFKNIFLILIKCGYKKFVMNCLEKMSKKFEMQYFIMQIMKEM